MEVIAIDGPGASGKSTLARLLGQALGLQIIESGKYYRYLTYILIQRNLLNAPPETIAQSLQKLENSDWAQIQSSETMAMLRQDQVSQATPGVAAIPAVRDIVNDKLRKLAAVANSVVEGRDIGTVVFPSTPWKIFMEVPLHLRELRRKAEGSGEILAVRDQADSQRKTAPLLAASDALILRVESETPEAVCHRALGLLQSKGYPITNI